MKTDNPRRRRATRRAYATLIGGALVGATVFFAIGLRVGQLATLRNAAQSEPEPLVLIEERPEPCAMEAPAVIAATPLTCVVVEELPEPVEEPTEELEMLAIVIYQEAGGDACSDDTRLKVGTVVMNRVADSRFPNTLYEVITQRAQYGRLYWTGPVWPERATQPGEAHAVERAYDCAERILEGERFLPEDVIFQAEFPQGTETVAEQDGFYFCR